MPGAWARRDSEGDLEVDGQSTSVSASFVLDCSGRAGVLARKRSPRSHLVAPHDCARRHLAGAPASGPSTSDTQTLVASYADGWAWSVPTEPGVRYFTVMVDPARTDLARDSSSRNIYLPELAKARAFGPMLERGALVGRSMGRRRVAVRRRPRTPAPGFLLVGDAASFIDPLSSFGVKKALVVGLARRDCHAHGAHAARDARRRRCGFFDRRERELLRERRAADGAVRRRGIGWRRQPSVLAGQGGQSTHDRLSTERSTRPPSGATATCSGRSRICGVAERSASDAGADVRVEAARDGLRPRDRRWRIT